MAGRCGCSKTCGCCTVGSDSISVSGIGSAGQCFRPEIKISTGEQNLATIFDDGLMVRACGTLPDGTPAEISPEGCLVIPPPVVLDYDGNPIAPNGAGEIPLPTGGLPPAYACGLQTDEDGILSVKTSGTWPGADLLGVPFEGDSSEGSEIYCDPVTGEIRGVPQGTAVTVGSSGGQVLAPTLLAVPGTWASPASAEITLTNPSLSRSMLVARFVSGTVDAVVAAQARVELRLQERVDGGAWGTVREISPAEPSGGTASSRSTLQASSWRVTQIPPGGSTTLELRWYAEKTGLGDSDPVLVEAFVSARMMGVSQ